MVNHVVTFPEYHPVRGPSRSLGSFRMLNKSALENTRVLVSTKPVVSGASNMGPHTQQFPMTDIQFLTGVEQVNPVQRQLLQSHFAHSQERCTTRTLGAL